MHSLRVDINLSKHKSLFTLLYLRIFSVVAIALELVRKRHHLDRELLQNPVIVCVQPLFSTESKMGEYKMRTLVHGLFCGTSPWTGSIKIWTASMDPYFYFP